MGVQDGNPVSAAYTNPRFISKNTPDVMPFPLGFTGSGASIADIQAAVNRLYDATGASESSTGTVYNATPGTVANGDTYEECITILANKFDAATGHKHTGDPGDGPVLDVVLTAALAGTGGSPIFGNITFEAGTGMTINQIGNNFVFNSAAGTTIAASGFSPLSGDVTLAPGSGGGINLSQSGQIIFIDAEPGTTVGASGYSQLSGAVTFVAGTGGISITQVGQNIIFEAGGGGGGSSSLTIDSFSGDDVETDFTLSTDPGTKANTWVFISGVYQEKDTYSVTGTTLSFSTPPPSGPDNIEVIIGGVSANIPSDGSVTYAKLASNLFVTPTVQTFTSGSGTYTTPTSPRTPLYIRVRMVGGGGGGGGSGTGVTAGIGGTGGNTTFSDGSVTLTAGGGSGGGNGAGLGGVGGSASLGSGPIGTASSGAGGGTGGQQPSGATGFLPGGHGAATIFGGGGIPGLNSVGNAAAANSGGGGGGAGTAAIGASINTGGGGGAGGFVDAIIASPSSTYSYSIGSGGTGGIAGTDGRAGGAGGSGYIEITEYYQ